MDAFFSDDAGNKLTFEPAPLTFSDAEKLSIIGATEKITLMGKKTTAYDTTPDDGDNTNDADMAITVKLSATDDGGQALMDDPADVFMVKVDMAPKRVGRIGHRVLELAGAEVMSDAVADVTKYFKDDRSPLKYIAWSSDPNVVTVMGNADNSKEYMLTGDDDTVTEAETRDRSEGPRLGDHYVESDGESSRPSRSFPQCRRDVFDRS